MDLGAFHELVTSLPGVRRAGGAAGADVARWSLHGRLVARELDATHVVVRVPFEVRDLLVRQSPEVFSVPSRFVTHMMVIADLAAGDDGAVEDAVSAAWQLQSDVEPGSAPADGRP